ncbi:hypothetical protein ACSX1A_01555 [Pontibacter sp. MBLB2868]|uniref:hypothetical protein n=1 Tax=Pontibacter sp. MBLB2868 TaxID=3451555 RepID=UPI003F754299
MKKLIINLLLSFVLFAGFSCNSDSRENSEEGKIPVSAEDPRAPTVAPDKPTTNIGAGLEDSLQEQGETIDSL